MDRADPIRTTVGPPGIELSGLTEALEASHHLFPRSRSRRYRDGAVAASIVRVVSCGAATIRESLISRPISSVSKEKSKISEYKPVWSWGHRGMGPPPRRNVWMGKPSLESTPSRAWRASSAPGGSTSARRGDACVPGHRTWGRRRDDRTACGRCRRDRASRAGMPAASNRAPVGSGMTRPRAMM